MKTREELRKEWPIALRSGKYQQATGELKDTDGAYCCLGVLCELAGIMDGRGAKFDGDYSITELPKAFREYMGMHGNSGDTYESNVKECLVNLNDDEQLTFDQIADELDKGDFYYD